MLIEKENTYATVEFADKYVAEHYPQYSSALRVHYSVLTDEEKETYLRAALREIEALPFAGRKTDYNQPLAFPRTIKAISYPYRGPFYVVIGGKDEFEIPQIVKEAQVENALGVLYSEINSVNDKQFMTLQSLGVIKNTKYNRREMGEIGFGADITGGGGSVCPLSSKKAYDMLKCFIGGVRIC